MRTLHVNLRPHAYPIYIGAGSLAESGRFVRRIHSTDRVAIVTDEEVYWQYGDVLADALKESGFDLFWIRIPPGEESKRFEVLESVMEELASRGLKREDLLIAFGGGVVGDLGGFAASCYMRGIRLVQIPTTLLAEVDSSVGGKTSINLSVGKNLVGAFWQPRMVIIDTTLLETLSSRQFACGMAEVIKYGALGSPELFQLLEENDQVQIRSHMEDIVYRCCDIKRQIVEEDEREEGNRMTLNFGHTFGHAIERLDGYGHWTHGEAVAIGMVLAAKAGEMLGHTEQGTANRLISVLSSHGLPSVTNHLMREILPLFWKDKKTENAGIRLVLIERIGKAKIHRLTASEAREITKIGRTPWNT